MLRKVSCIAHQLYAVYSRHALVLPKACRRLCCAGAVADKSKHALVKEAWEFLHQEGHINQGILQGAPAVKAACKACKLCPENPS